MTGPVLPFRHLSVRVPWHDTAYDGRICADPLANGACLRLKRISEERDDAHEVALAGRSWLELEPRQLPPCAAERAGLMSPTPRGSVKNHPYAAWNDVYRRRFRETAFEIPPFSADCVPFRWMLRDEAVAIADQYEIPYEGDLEAAVDAEANLKSPAWVQHATNQQALLDTFFSAIQPEKSLIFVYAKESPLAADPRRVLIGVGRVRSVGAIRPYEQSGDGFGSVMWERAVGHTIRPNSTDGFLLPYHDLLRLANEDASIDLESCTVFVPDEFTDQFSYASEHVSHDAALSILLELDRVVEKIAPLVSGTWDAVRQWLSDRVAEVWEARGPCPGLGAALSAFGVPEGVLLAFSAQGELGDNEDPWPLVNSWLRNPSAHPAAAKRVESMLSRTWAALPDERRALLKLLSRFALTPDQARRLYQRVVREAAGIDVDDSGILANPYLVYETGRLCPDPVAVGTVDRGVFPDDRVRLAHPLPAPSLVTDPLDPRRVRALIVSSLEAAAVEGHSLRPQDHVVLEISDAALQPACPLGDDVMSVIVPDLAPEVVVATMADEKPALQLSRLTEIRKAIAKTVTRRRRAKPLPVSADWRAVIDARFTAPATDPEEELARREKAAALEVLATSRISVLIGAAGTGKTTLLRALCSLDAVKDGGVSLLAPTGKARVRMHEAIGQEVESRALTIAQFLLRSERYDPETSRYRRSDRDRDNTARTIIVDECSMLTEDAIDALLDALEGYDRLILVGDHRQLPPIGTGRPFVDIVNYLREEAGQLAFPRVAPSYAELTIPRRQVTSGDDDRADLQLAEWFAGSETSPGADEIWDRLRRGEDLGTVRLRRWENAAELRDVLRAELATSLSAMQGDDDATGFQVSYGGTQSGEYVYFNLGAAEQAESWQVLSPVRVTGGGVNELNRYLQRTYREEIRQLAAPDDPRFRKIPKPAGPEEIVYGDKVINVRNKKRTRYYPKIDNALEYVANGEIGVITGPTRFATRNAPLGLLEVEFATQLGTSYKFWMSEMGEEGTPPLELAYAITIHKSQGSEFGRTFVVIPSPCRPLSRELLYTALTRQREHVTVLHQGDVSDLLRYAKASYSETAARITNLFRAPNPVDVDGRYLEDGLIHMTRKGIAVRSKSEVIIADLLYSKGIDFEYERPLDLDGDRKLPDFTIADSDTGETYYWEHLGMLQRPSYRRKWEAKQSWYTAHGILDEAAGGGENGTLITTRDGDDGSISSAAIEELIDKLFA
ncbi:AAA family ATPase [Trujillonella humicola]|uniref:AAA family ATPase n=1 Tax=Trujillonella humicola TaxID=3383699 RepID=UPI0039058DD9